MYYQMVWPFFTKHYPGYTEAIMIVVKNKIKHEEPLEKKFTTRLQHFGLHVQNYLDSWAIFCDKAYQVALDFLLVIRPFNKSVNRTLGRTGIIST